MPIIQTDKKLNVRHENDFYPTPYELCWYAITELDSYIYPASTTTPSGNLELKILDPGAGNGVWGRSAMNLLRTFYNIECMYGVDKFIEKDRARLSMYYTDWSNVDYLSHTFTDKYNLIIGNPPYKLAEEFVHTSRELLSDNGLLVFLLRLGFLEGQKRSNGLWKSYKPKAVYTLGKRPSFTYDGKTDATAYAIYVWGKYTNKHHDPALRWLYWNYSHESYDLHKIISPLVSSKKEILNKLDILERKKETKKVTDTEYNFVRAGMLKNLISCNDSLEVYKERMDLLEHTL